MGTPCRESDSELAEPARRRGAPIPRREHIWRDRQRVHRGRVWGSRPGSGNLLRVSRTPQPPTEHHSHLSSRFSDRLTFCTGGGANASWAFRILADRDLTTSWYRLGRCHHMDLHIFRFPLRPCPDFCWWGPLEVTHESN